MVESMHQGRFLSKRPSNAWEFLKDLAKQTMQWETIRNDSLNSMYSGVKGGMDAVFDLSHLEFKFVAHQNMMNELVLQ